MLPPHKPHNHLPQWHVLWTAEDREGMLLSSAQMFQPSETCQQYFTNPAPFLRCKSQSHPMLPRSRRTTARVLSWMHGGLSSPAAL